MRSNAIRHLTVAAMLAALTFVATRLIQIPLPMGAGYVHPGDCVVFLSGFILGPVWGAGAAGVGAMLADLTSSWPQYALPTLLIKALSAFLAAVIWRALKNRSKGEPIVPALIAGVVASIPIVLGYFLCDWVLTHSAVTAAAAIPGNILQGLFGTASSTILIVLIGHSGALRRFLDRLDKQNG